MDGDNHDQEMRRKIAEANERFLAESAERNKPRPPTGLDAATTREIEAAGATLNQWGLSTRTMDEVDPAVMSGTGLSPAIGASASNPRSRPDPFARPANTSSSADPRFQRPAFGSEIPEPKPTPTPEPTLALALEPTPEPTLTPAPAPAQRTLDPRFQRSTSDAPRETQSRHSASADTQREQAAPDQAEQTPSPERTPELTPKPKLDH